VWGDNVANTDLIPVMAFEARMSPIIKRINTML
jgi:hypothetical protein